MVGREGGSSGSSRQQKACVIVVNATHGEKEKKVVTFLFGRSPPSWECWKRECNHRVFLPLKRSLFGHGCSKTRSPLCLCVCWTRSAHSCRFVSCTRVSSLVFDSPLSLVVFLFHTGLCDNLNQFLLTSAFPLPLFRFLLVFW